jgi:hypothetical protein
VLFEWKGGENTVADQLRRYNDLTPASLAPCNLPGRAANCFDVAIVGRAEHRERLLVGVRDGNYPFPVLLVDDGGIALSLNQFQCGKLNAVFSPKLVIDFDGTAPLNFVPIDADSEPWEVALVIMPIILQRMHERDAVVTVDVLCIAACRLWSSMRPPARDGVKARVREVLEQASIAEFRDYLRWDKGGAVEIISNPVAFKADKRHAAFKRLQKSLQAFCLRLQSGRRYVRDWELFGD